jgi:hypothetical protein
MSVGGVELCTECVADLYRCARCNRPTEDVQQTHRGSNICTECAATYYSPCGRCDLLVRDGQRLETADGSYVCPTCRRNHYWVCAGSDCSVLLGEGDYCSESCEPDDSAYIQYYSYKPTPVFHGDGPLYLGFELEINTPRYDLDRCAAVASNALDSLGYLKEDSSISYGFEMVTHPMSHEYARTKFPWHMLHELAERGCDGHDTGLHVHVSREGFSSPAHVYRWLKFLYRNSEHVTVVARRDSDEWAAWHYMDRERAKDYAKGSRSAGRYSAVNVTNRTTFEVRVFASSLEPQEVQAALDLVAGSVEYTRDLTVVDINARGGWTWSAFTAWAAGRPEYAALTRELEGDFACAC